MHKFVVSASAITPRLAAAVRAHFVAEDYGTSEPGPVELAAYATQLCGHLDSYNLARRAEFEASNGETERAEIMSAEVERRHAIDYACEECGGEAGPDYYSADDCNQTGERVVICEACEHADPVVIDEPACTAATHGPRNSTCTCEDSQG